MSAESIKKESVEWNNYEDLVAERPDEFRQNEMLEIITDLEAVCNFEQKTGRTIGVVYKSPFHMLIVDLVRNREGKLFAYERILPTVAKGAVVSVPVYKGKFVLLRQFRHSLRDFQYAFPRGFAESNLSAEENVRKELREEINGEVQCVQLLGEIVADSGLSGNRVTAYYCEVTSMQIHEGYEGIDSHVLLTQDEIRQWITSGKINDGFTLAAYGMYSNLKVSSADR